MSNITIKGNKEGITVYINSSSYEEVKDELLEKLEKGKDFFKGSNLKLINAQDKLSYEHCQELQSIIKESFGINMLYPNETNVPEKNEKVFSGIYEGRTKFCKSTIRSGQRIIYNGNIVVIGDVNSGAEVIASGNIVVLGVLRGVAHAGSNGNRRAFVAAYMLQPSQLRIGDIISRSPDDRAERPRMPEVAKIKDSTIVVEPYLPNKYI